MSKPTNVFVAEWASGRYRKLQEVGPEKGAPEELPLLSLTFLFPCHHEVNTPLETGSSCYSVLPCLRPQCWRQPTIEGNLES